MPEKPKAPAEKEPEEPMGEDAEDAYHAALFKEFAEGKPAEESAEEPDAAEKEPVDTSSEEKDAQEAEREKGEPQEKPGEAKAGAEPSEEMTRLRNELEEAKQKLRSWDGRINAEVRRSQELTAELERYKAEKAKTPEDTAAPPSEKKPDEELQAWDAMIAEAVEQYGEDEPYVKMMKLQRQAHVQQQAHFARIAEIQKQGEALQKQFQDTQRVVAPMAETLRARDEEAAFKRLTDAHPDVETYRITDQNWEKHPLLIWVRDELPQGSWLQQRAAWALRRAEDYPNNPPTHDETRELLTEFKRAKGIPLTPKEKQATDKEPKTTEQTLNTEAVPARRTGIPPTGRMPPKDADEGQLFDYWASKTDKQQ